MTYRPDTLLPIRIVYDAERRGYTIEEARRFTKNGAFYENDVNNIDNLGSETWVPIALKYALSDAVYNVLYLMNERNRELRSIDLGPARPTDPAVAAIVDKLTQLAV